MADIIDKNQKRALYLSYFTVGYNIFECCISIIAGFLAGSTALLSFGSDSFVESISGIIMIWRFRKKGILSDEDEEKIERKASHLVGISFFIFGMYLLIESIRKLLFEDPPEPSLIGILIAIASIVIMPVLFYLKYKEGKRINSKSLIADSKQTLACLFMSVSLFIGLGLNYWFNFWQADPLVGLFIVAFLFKEGYEVLFEEDEND